MAFSIGAAIQTGVNRSIQRNGLMLLGVYYALFVTMALFMPVAQTQGDSVSFEPAIGVPAVVGWLVTLLVLIASVIVNLAAMRTFVSEETETIPREFFTHNVVFALVNLFVGGIVFSIAFTIGSVFLLIPGLFLLVSLYFWNFYVVVEDDNFVTAFSRSWELTEGNRLSLFFLGATVFVIATVIVVPFVIPTLFIGAVVGTIVLYAGVTIISIFSLATAAAAFNQLRSIQGASGETTFEAGTDDATGFESPS